MAAILEEKQKLMKARWLSQPQVNLKTYNYPEEVEQEYKVYLMGNKELNWYKIGISLEPERRLLSFSLPFEILFMTSSVAFSNLLASKLVEDKVHKHYHSKHLRGEWFSNIDALDFLEISKRFILSMLDKDWRNSEEGMRLRFGSEKQKVAFDAIMLKRRVL